ncbi:multicopper oxidase LPR1 homolog 1-like [Malania oleifera]|uniref:multicopper oxidase LPR1 homolog 1-like n=1 Tax=Malania oleifera TaxID=397392 RepID=UPI0025AE6D63|nr:multicopper oxidase LPR1 homolog 1-like [Malania oleifera]
MASPDSSNQSDPSSQLNISKPFFLHSNENPGSTSSDNHHVANASVGNGLSGLTSESISVHGGVADLAHWSTIGLGKECNGLYLLEGSKDVVFHEEIFPFDGANKSVSDPFLFHSKVDDIANSSSVSSSPQEPQSFFQVVKDPLWKETMDKEIQALEKTYTWERSTLPPGKSPIGSKAVTVRVLIALAAAKAWSLHQLDTNNAFLHGDLDEEVYMSLPLGYHSKGGSSSSPIVCKLLKSLYALRKASRQLYTKLSITIQHLGFIQSTSDHCLFVHSILDAKFGIKDLGSLKYFLGLEIARSEKGISLNQKKFALDILKETGMMGCKPVNSPMEQQLKLSKDSGDLLTDSNKYRRLIGKLMYLTLSRLDLTYAVKRLNQFLAKSRHSHMQAATRILQYIKGTSGQGVFFPNDSNLQLKAYCDADWMRRNNIIRAISVLLFLRLSFAQPPPVSKATLHKVAASLKMYVDELPQMPRLYGYTTTSPPHASINPTNLTIGMYQSKWKFHRDLPATTVFAYGTSAATATVPGPTIEAIKGTPTSVTWQNHLPQSHILPWDPTVPTAIPKAGGVPTVVHLHGGVHPPKSDGHALAWFTANFRETGPTWSGSTYTYPNVQHSGNLWYHDHAVGLTRVNLLAGLIGAYVIRDAALDSSLKLPVGPEFDRHLMIFDRSFNVDGSLYMNRTGDNPNIHPQWQPEYFGDAIIVNGKAWPYLKVQRRKYRFRIINASNARHFRFSLTNGLSFIQVGSDSSYLPRPVRTRSILLSPSETADVIIDFSATSASESELTNDAPYPYPTGNPVDELNSKVMKFIIIPGVPNPPDNSRVPRSLKAYQLPTTTAATARRYITLYEYQSAAGTPTHLYINGKRFEDPPTETPKSGSTEVWEVINLTEDNHPLHIHLATFQAVKVQQMVGLDVFAACMGRKNDAVGCNVTEHATGKIVEVPENERTWKNSVKIAPGCQTTVVVKFNLVDGGGEYPFDATADPGYVYHCHILDHEDNAMIRPLKLIS